ncbi:MAG TPA: hypothetical protein VK593_07720 [Edaphobacter sp.]|nr:hypothetical protein [Edaphobacter sp.]
MRKVTSTAALVLVFAFPALAAKIKGNATLKDTQTAGIKDKTHKHQAYDLFFDAQGKSYTCRTDSDKSMNATDFVVGAQMRYEVDGDKAKIWSPEDKKVECKIVRVEITSHPM